MAAETGQMSCLLPTGGPGGTGYRLLLLMSLC